MRRASHVYIGDKLPISCCANERDDDVYRSKEVRNALVVIKSHAVWRTIITLFDMETKKISYTEHSCIVNTCCSILLHI